jgi:hypothetical protein
MIAGKREETGTTKATFQIISQKVTGMPRQSILIYILLTVLTRYGLVALHSAQLWKDEVCRRHKTNCDVVLLLLLQN